MFKTLAANLKLACNLLSEHGIEPVFEMINSTDMPRFLVQNIAQGQEMLEAVNHPALKMQYDCYHMAMMGEDVLEGLQENINLIGHIQFADCPGRHEPDTAQILMNKFFLVKSKVHIRTILQRNINLKMVQISRLHGRKILF